MNDQQSVSRGTVDGIVPGSPLAACTPPSATSLLDLPAALLDDISCRALQLGATALARTCRAFHDANLRHAPTFCIPADRQRCEQLLTARVVAALRARTSRFSVTIEEQQQLFSKQSNNAPVAHILAKLGSCAAAEACKLQSSAIYSRDCLMVMDCAPGLAQSLLDSFPCLTALSLRGYAIGRSDLASLLSHPQLALQLQQLDLTSTNFTRPWQYEEPLPNLFHGLRLKQLSLDVGHNTSCGLQSILPDLQPLVQHLTNLHLCMHTDHPLYRFMSEVAPLAQLQVLTISNLKGADTLDQLLEKALPQLHTLQLPNTPLRMHHDNFDRLLAATQVTNLQLGSIEKLTRSRANAPCSWHQLELTGSVDCNTIVHLPLHSLTQPLVFGRLGIAVYEDWVAVPAAIRNLAHCKVPVMFNSLLLDMSGSNEASATDIAAAQQRIKLMRLIQLLQSVQYCRVGMLTVRRLKDVSAADVPALAPLCRGCIHLVFESGSIKPSLLFWRQLVQLMPTVQQVTFDQCGAATGAMHKCMQSMAEQPWARWLDITIAHGGSELPDCWESDSLSQLGKFRVCLE